MDLLQEEVLFLDRVYRPPGGGSPDGLRTRPQVPQGIPDNAAHRIPGPEHRPARIGLEHSPVHYGHRLRRRAGQRLPPGHAEPLSLPASAEHRLHLLHHRGGVGLHRRLRGILPVLRPAQALLQSSQDREGLLRHLRRRRDNGDDLLPFHDQRRHGDGDHAGNRDTPVLPVLWRRLSLGDHDRDRPSPGDIRQAVPDVRRAGHRRVDPLSELGGDLLRVERPSRYLGGESGCVRKGDDSLLTIALCFPDLYEIGMSNNAIRILYSGLNAMPGVRAERIFAPAPDFESLLASKGLPLYTLETGIAVHDVDILGFSLGYELAATSVITVLKSGLVPVRASERGEGDPIVLAGGPAATNPHPLAAFIDAAYIGEAEAGFFDLADELGRIKRDGGRRSDMLDT